jgi:hypothetical protein
LYVSRPSTHRRPTFRVLSQSIGSYYTVICRADRINRERVRFEPYVCVSTLSVMATNGLKRSRCKVCSDWRLLQDERDVRSTAAILAAPGSRCRCGARARSRMHRVLEGVQTGLKTGLRLTFYSLIVLCYCWLLQKSVSRSKIGLGGNELLFIICVLDLEPITSPIRILQRRRQMGQVWCDSQRWQNESQPSLCGYIVRPS